MQMSKEAQDELNVKRATATPLWKGLTTMIKYRTTHNYKDGEFLGARIGDKFIFALLIGTLYLGIGDDLKPENLINISAVLFMWSTLPAYAPAIP
jgi:ATP-binding cassette, subfamily G (WHITE), member 2